MFLTCPLSIYVAQSIEKRTDFWEILPVFLFDRRQRCRFLRHGAWVKYSHKSAQYSFYTVDWEANRLLRMCSCLPIWKALRALNPTTRCNRHTFSKVRVGCILHSQVSSKQTFENVYLSADLQGAASADSYDALQQAHILKSPRRVQYS